jgi:NAD(P)H-nitrite reductase large subunit
MHSETNLSAGDTAEPATSTSTTNNGIVIIGAGLAGWGVIDAIRAKDKDIAITLITSDNGDRYHKPMLTMAISQNKTPADLVRATGVDAAATANVTLMAQARVTNINAADKQVTVAACDDSLWEKTISYDSLVLAMGAHPAFPKSLPEEVVWHVNHIERFGQLQAELSQGPQKIAIVGAGMVGTEIAEDLLKAGHDITLIDLNDAPLAQLLPKQATTRIREAIRSQGIQFLGGCKVDTVTPLDNGQYEVSYSPLETQQAADSDSADANSGKFVVDHVIASTGLLVDAKLPESAGINFDRRSGIVVDEQTLQTSQADVYAIGDCMSIGGVPCRYVAPLRAQAATIADAILGHEHTGYSHKPPMIRLKNKAISVMVTGVPDACANWQSVTETADELVMEQHDSAGAVAATVTVKSPLA